MAFLIVQSYSLVFVGVVCMGFLVRLLLHPRRRLPPGPKGLPLIGNINDLPPHNQPPYKHWIALKDKYGPLSSVTVMGQTIVVIGDHSMAFELMDKRGAKHSGRPASVFANELCGFEDGLGVQNHTQRQKDQRRLVNNVVGSTSTLRRFVALEEGEIHRFLGNIVHSPDSWRQHLQTLFGAVILDVAYGYRPRRGGSDLFCDNSMGLLAGWKEAAVPGKWVVDMVPWLKYVPEWMPGASFHSKARYWKNLRNDTKEAAMRFVETRIDQNMDERSMVSDFLHGKHGGRNSYEWQNMNEASSVLMFAGIDTSTGAFSWSLVAMLHHPEVVRKAQEEIDRVIGSDRLPTFADRPHLPYIDAIWKESLRWNVMAPLSIPHATTEDDEFEGYHIPKGSILLPLTVSFCHDPSVYSEPDKYRPERFLGDNPERDPDKSGVFGWGRRICPGRGLAQQGGWMLLAKTLASMDILPVKDANGRDVLPALQGVDGVAGMPNPFRAVFRPRSEKHAEMIAGLSKGASYDYDDAELFEKLYDQVCTERRNGVSLTEKV